MDRTPTHSSLEVHRDELIVLLAVVNRSNNILQNIDHTSLPNLDWEWLVNACGRLKLVQSFYEALQALSFPSPPWVRRALWVRIRRNRATAQRHIDELCELASLLEDKQISFRAMRGPVLSQLVFGTPDKREYCDLDILVGPPDIDRTRTALEARGYHTPESLDKIRQNCALQMFNRERQVGLDLHWSEVPYWLPVGTTFNVLEQPPSNMNINGLDIPTLPPEETILVQVVQCVKCGWRELDKWHDLITLIRLWPQLDWQRVMQVAEASGYFRSLILTLRLLDPNAHLELPETLRTSLRQQEPDLQRAQQLIESHLRVTPHQYAEWAQNQPKHNFLVYLSSIHFPIAIWCLVTDNWHQRLAVYIWVAKLLSTPTPADIKSLRLPDRFGGLYYITRPFRLILKSLRLRGWGR